MSLYDDAKKIIEVIQDNDFYDRTHFFVVKYSESIIKVIAKKNNRLVAISKFSDLNSLKTFIAINNV